MAKSNERTSNSHVGRDDHHHPDPIPFTQSNSHLCFNKKKLNVSHLFIYKYLKTFLKINFKEILITLKINMFYK